MKVTDIRRKLMAALAAGGLLSPAAAQAANLGQNLVVNGGFENIDFFTIGEYGSVLILDWAGMGFAYSHDGSSGAPDFANPEPEDNPFPETPDFPLVNGGSYYFSPGAGPDGAQAHDSLETAITQTIDLSTGATASTIAAGTARFNLSAYFSTYLTQVDRGVIHVDFRNAASASLGTAMVSPPEHAPFLSTWTPFAADGLIPVGTQTVLVSSYGIAASGSPDGYTDNVNFTVTNNTVIEPALEITVDRETGNLTLSNQTGATVNLAEYSITSAFGALDPGDWLSIADNYDNGNPGPNQVDTNPWVEIAATNDELSEAETPAANGAALANGRTVNLGAAWIGGPVEDLVFSYTSGGQELPGIVAFTGNGGNPFDAGDLNADGVITAADWMQFRASQHADLTGDSLAEAYRRGDLDGDNDNDFDDFSSFKSLYDAANGAGAFQAMAQGVPEPATLVLAGMAGVSLCSAARRRRST